MDMDLQHYLQKRVMQCQRGCTTCDACCAAFAAPQELNASQLPSQLLSKKGVVQHMRLCVSTAAVALVSTPVNALGEDWEH